MIGRCFVSFILVRVWVTGDGFRLWMKGMRRLCAVCKYIGQRSAECQMDLR